MNGTTEERNGNSEARKRQKGGIVPASLGSCHSGKSCDGLAQVLKASTSAELAIARGEEEALKPGNMESKTSPLRLVGGGKSEEEQPTPSISGEKNRAGTGKDPKVNITLIPRLMKGIREVSKQVSAIRKRPGPRSRTRTRSKRIFIEDSDTEGNMSQTSPEKERDRSRQRRNSDQETVHEIDTATSQPDTEEGNKEQQTKERGVGEDVYNAQPSLDETPATPLPPKRAREEQKAHESTKIYDTDHYRNLAEAKGLANEEMRRALELANEEKWRRRPMR